MALMLVRPTCPPAANVAETLLHTWIRRDPNRLQVELERTAQSALEQPDDEETEMLQLLKSIALRMKACPNMFASRSTDPGLDVCVDLLVHLVIRGDYPRVPGATREPI